MAEYGNNKKELSTLQKEKLERESEIMKKIKLLPKSKANLQYPEKRQLVLKEIDKKTYKESTIDLQNNSLILIDIPKIRKLRNEKILQKISEITGVLLTYEQKLLKILDELNSSETFEYEGHNDDVEIPILPITWILKKENTIYSKYSLRSFDDISNDSTNDSSLSRTSSTVSDHLAESWIEEKLYDKILYSDIYDKLGSKLENFDNKYIAYEYPNDLKTYIISMSQLLLSQYKFGKISQKEMDKKNFNSKLGLYFCGKDIKESNKKCEPNQMICKDCMKKNKEMYHLDGDKSLLININGRICSNAFRDKKFHCYGKFKIGKAFNTCIYKKDFKDFCCKACQELNKNFAYYSQ